MHTRISPIRGNDEKYARKSKQNAYTVGLLNIFKAYSCLIEDKKMKPQQKKLNKRTKILVLSHEKG